jgi:N-(5-amino-5-carboxypentanoyl)-L-cysteinyl-D-valine synthase
MVDHVEQSRLSCVAPVESVERSVWREDSYVDPAELLQRGLFDAVLVRAASGAPAELPPFPLAVVVRDEEGESRLCWTLTYSAHLFEDKVIAGVLDVAREVLGQLVTRPDPLIGDLELVSEGQKRQLDSWNATDGDFPDQVRLEELFEAAVRRTPQSEAVVCGQTRLSYRELNDRCNRLAHRLLVEGVRPEEAIALHLDKSSLVVVAALIASWKRYTGAVTSARSRATLPVRGATREKL